MSCFDIGVLLYGITPPKLRLLQPSNVSSPRDVTLSGNGMSVNFVHCANAQFPIDVTVSGIVTDSRLSHP